MEHGIWGPEPVCQGHSPSLLAPVSTVPIPFEMTAVSVSIQKTKGQNTATSTQRFCGGKELTCMINIIPK